MTDYDNDDLEEALRIWREPFRENPEAVHRALSIVRHWRTELKAELRSMSRKDWPAEYAMVKKQEERLENATLDLHSALLLQMNARKTGG